MSRESKLPLSSSQTGGVVRSSSRFSGRFLRPNWLPWRQWLVLFTMGAVIIGVEVHNHSSMWQRLGGGLTFWSDTELLYEIIFYGLVLPILGAAILGYFGRMASERNRLTRDHELRRKLVRQMQAVKGWPELAQLVVSTPSTFASADRAWLFAQSNDDDEQLEQIAHWERLAPELLPPYPPVSPAVCESCAGSPRLKGTRIMICDHPGQSSNEFGCNRYCLRLSSEGRGKTMLLFDLPADHLLDPGQIKALDDIADEMSLAIDNARLQAMEQRQDDVARDERLRIARDLHDTLAQNISYLRLKLGQINTARPGYGSTEFQEDLAKMLLVAEEAYEQVRDTLNELRTTEHRDLEEDLRPYVSQVSKRSGFSIDVQSCGSAGDLSCRQNREIMYIIREALNNVEKHADAQHVDINLRRLENELILTLGDDGKGFQPEEIDAGDHYGLAIMRERAQAINAELVIDSAPGKGTELIVSLPLTHRATVASRS